MTYCFLSAMAAEVEPILKAATLIGEENLGFARLYHLDYQGIPFYVCLSGVGKVLAGSAATACCLVHKDIDAFINIGIGGSLDAIKAPCLSAVIGKDFAQHDLDTTAVGDPLGYLSGLDIIKIDADSALNEKISGVCKEIGIPCCEGSMASGDRFIANEADMAKVVKNFGALLIDMEASAYAEVCYLYHKPFTALRIVSDAVDHEKEYVQNKKAACEKACLVALALLSSSSHAHANRI